MNIDQKFLFPRALDTITERFLNVAIRILLQISSNTAPMHSKIQFRKKYSSGMLHRAHIIEYCYCFH